MKSHYILITILIFFINNILIWYQLNGQLVWDFWKSWKGIGVSLLMAIPITALFWYATKWGYIGVGNLWAVRFMGFATSMITFPIMTYLYLGGNYNFKNFNYYTVSYCYNGTTVIIIINLQLYSY